jgi:hypothetical protein
MMSRTAQRLRDTATAIGETIRDVPDLRLPEPRTAYADARRPRVQRLVPLLAAATVLVLIGSLLALRHELRGEPASPRASKHTVSIGVVEGTPTFLVTAQDARGYIRGTFAGHVRWKIRPPVPGFAIEGLATTGDDYAPANIYLAGEVFRPAGARLEFYRVTLGNNQRPGPSRRVPGPAVAMAGSVTSDGLVNIPVAVSGGGTELAFVPTSPELIGAASRPPMLTIRNVRTGASRSWLLPPSPDTQISEVSWGSGGQLCLTATIGNATVSNGVVRRHAGTEVSVIMMLNTKAGGTSLLADSRLISYGEMSMRSGAASGAKGPVAAVVADGGRRIVAQLNEVPKLAELAVIAVATGQVIKVLLRGPRAAQAMPMAADGDNVLFTLSPKHEHRSGHYVCGHLADAQPSQRDVFGLPFPVYCSTEAPPPPFQATW